MGADVAHTLRPARAVDLDFLWSMLGAAASPHGDPVPAPEAKATPELARYLEDWGRPHDAGLVAVDAAGSPVAACWYRLFAADEPGYGFVDEVTPELAIACVPEARGHGLGHQLIRGIQDVGRRQGHARLSLSVLVSNAAGIRVYENCGFEVVGHGPDGDDQIMVAHT